MRRIWKLWAVFRFSTTLIQMYVYLCLSFLPSVDVALVMIIRLTIRFPSSTMRVWRLSKFALTHIDYRSHFYLHWRIKRSSTNLLAGIAHFLSVSAQPPTPSKEVHHAIFSSTGLISGLIGQLVPRPGFKDRLRGVILVRHSPLTIRRQDHQAHHGVSNWSLTARPV